MNFLLVFIGPICYMASMTTISSQNEGLVARPASERDGSLVEHTCVCAVKRTVAETGPPDY